MHPRAVEFSERAAEEYGLEVEVHEFDEGTKTAADAAAAVGCDVAQIASSIVMLANDEPIVVVTSGANRVDEAKVGEERGAQEVRMAEAEEIRETLGWSIGGVPPICHETAVPVLFDESLARFDTVWAAAGTPEAVFPVAPDRLVELADAARCDVVV
jgi:prolyl-tRNA editing enzyme YbaK/EbsC (Cys-tRNA(Pro) deacylase)